MWQGKKTTITVTGRPTVNDHPVPDGWELYCAPRPLYGSYADGHLLADKRWSDLTWVDNGWMPGRLLAAINPDDPDADTWREHNREMHAHRVYVVTQRQAVEEGQRFYARFPDVEIDIDDPQTRCEVLKRGLRQMSDMEE